MAKVMSFGVWCLTHKIFSSVNFASGEAAMLLSLSVFVGIIANLCVFFLPYSAGFYENIRFDRFYNHTF